MLYISKGTINTCNAGVCFCWAQCCAPVFLCLSESSFDRYAGRECIAFGVRDSDDVISGCRGECHLMQISCFSDVTVVQMPVYRGVVIAVGEAADYAFATAAELERDSDCAA